MSGYSGRQCAKSLVDACSSKKNGKICKSAPYLVNIFCCVAIGGLRSSYDLLLVVWWMIWYAEVVVGCEWPMRD